MVDALWDYNEQVLKKIYNLHQLKTKYILSNKKKSKFLIKYGLWNLYKNDVNSTTDTDSSSSDSNELSKFQLRHKINKLVKLAVTQDESVCIAQDFICKFTDELIKQKPHVANHLQEKFTPIVMRQINTSIRNYRHDKKRITRQAFMNRRNHVSQRQSLSARKAVCRLSMFYVYQ